MTICRRNRSGSVVSKEKDEKIKSVRGRIVARMKYIQTSNW